MTETLGVLAVSILLSGVLIMTAIARLAAAAAAISTGVARIGTEVTETTAAIRAHLEGDSGISQTELLAQVEKLEAAGAALTDAGNNLDALQAELNAGQSDAPPASDESAPAPDSFGLPPSDVSDPNVDPAVAGDTAAPASDAEFGNQNGIGSEMEQGAPGAIETGREGGDGSDAVLNDDADKPAI